MKFKGAGHVWDSERNKILISFNSGIAETEDERTIAILKQNGYEEFKDELETQIKSEIESEIESEETVPNARKDWNEIKKKAANLGIKVQGKKKDELLRLIAEKENVDNIDRS